MMENKIVGILPSDACTIYFPNETFKLKSGSLIIINTVPQNRFTIDANGAVINMFVLKSQIICPLEINV